jgi:hypothetical protein
MTSLLQMPGQPKPVCPAPRGSRVAADREAYLAFDREMREQTITLRHVGDTPHLGSIVRETAAVEIHASVAE